MNSLPIIYENEEILVINKPYGLAVQGGQGVKSSVDNLLSNQCGYRVHLVHRLDKDTSGLLIVAKNSSYANKWTNLIGSKQVTKEYKALCFGDLNEKKGFFSYPIEHRGIVKNAKTQFEVIKTAFIAGTEQKVSLVSLMLETGRMHQIRIHLAKNETPIVGDDKYGDFSLNKRVKKTAGIRKLHLAAVSLDFFNTILEIPLPSHMLKTLTLLD